MRLVDADEGRDAPDEEEKRDQEVHDHAAGGVGGLLMKKHSVRGSDGKRCYGAEKELRIDN